MIFPILITPIIQGFSVSRLILMISHPVLRGRLTACSSVLPEKTVPAEPGFQPKDREARDPLPGDRSVTVIQKGRESPFTVPEVLFSERKDEKQPPLSHHPLIELFPSPSFCQRIAFLHS